MNKVEAQKLQKNGVASDNLCQKGEPSAAKEKEHDLSDNLKNLFLYSEELSERPRVASLIGSLVRYDASIPSLIQEEGKETFKKAKLGTIAGVYLPCIQNIFGVIFFIRLVWIVGTAGTIVAFFIVLLCCCVTFTTCISLSAIATNGIVPAGGSYFMISRSLGPEFGGAVGILFYLATTFAGAMYLVGAVEIFLVYLAPQWALYGDLEDQSVMYHNFRTYGSILLIVVGIMVFIGVAFVSKFAPIALFCVIMSIIGVYIGVFVNIYGKHDLKICVLGDRILSSRGYGVCSKDMNVNESLFYVYCERVNTTVDNSSQDAYKCASYFEENEAKYISALPGLASGVLLENLKPQFRSRGDIVSRIPPDEDKYYAEIIVDITTSFTVLVGIFFPSCTGIMAGSNRSGDLDDAQKSIPTGTLAAQITTSIVYLSGVIFFGASFDNLFLRDKFGESIGGGLAVANLAWPHPLAVVIGSLLSTVGAGLQSLTGAPRLLQAIAQDGIIPAIKPFARTSARKEPTRALFITLFICWIGILIGNLDYIAPILTMFFLICYMFVNLACTVQSLLCTPGWRPRFKCYHWLVSLLGVIMCLIVMFISSWYYAIFSMVLAGCIYKYIEYSGAETEWGDGLRGLALSAARFSLLSLEEGPMHAKNYRPQVLVLCSLDNNLVPKYRKLFSFASQLKAGRGLTLLCSVIEGDFHKQYANSCTAKQKLKNIMEEEKVKGFVDVVVSRRVSDGLCHLIQTAGLGGLKHNTVILGWPNNWKDPNSYSWKRFLDTVRIVSASKSALLVPKGINYFPASDERLSGTIDIWWIVHDGGLLMLLPFLLKQHKTWSHCKLRIFTVAHMDDNSIQMKQDLSKFLYHLRIEAEVEVVEMQDSDISAYTYERTLIMEQRAEMIKEMKLRRKSSFLAKSATSLVKAISATRLFGGEDDSIATIPPEEESKELSFKKRSDSINSFDQLLKNQPNEANVRRMHTAVKLNDALITMSHDAQLIVINLPGPPKQSIGEETYMEFLEVLTEGLDRVLMVRGSGQEVITIYS